MIIVDKVYLGCDEELEAYILRDTFSDRYLIWSDLEVLADVKNLKFIEENYDVKVEDIIKSDSVIIIDKREIAERIADEINGDDRL